MFNIVDGRGSGSYKALHMEKKRRPRAYREVEIVGFLWFLTQMDRILYLMISELIMCCICFV